MTLLLVNVGNSRTVAVTATRGGGLDHDVAEVHAGDTPRDAAGVAGLADALARSRPAGAEVAVASVVPEVTAALDLALPGARSVDHTWDFPFGVAVRSPETVGADRWCNVAAATTAGLGDAIVVDAGTATTIDVLEDGVFRGGLIAPGMAFAARKLQETAARLWPVPFAPCDLRPGRDTDEALRIGAYHVGVHGVMGVVDALASRRPGVPVVVTGGLAAAIPRPDWRHDPLWTFRGLAALAGR